MTKRLVDLPLHLAAAIIALALLCLPALAAPPQIIFDTDFRSDCDDVGALAALHKMADAGDCTILGIVAGTTGPGIVAAIDAIDTYYGRPDVPIGLSPVPNVKHGDSYAPRLADPKQFPSDQTNATAPNAVALYRKLLHAAPDKSVKVVVVGYATVPALLLKTAANHEGDGIPLSGPDLVKRKVIEMIQMAGIAPGKSDGFNLAQDPQAAVEVAKNWPTPIVYSAPGQTIQTGKNLADPKRNPVARAYELCPLAGGAGVIGDRSSWDQLATIFAVRGGTWSGTKVVEQSPPGRIRLSIRTVENPKNKDKAVKVAGEYTADPAGTRYYLTQVADDKTIAPLIEALMVAPPGRR